MDRLDSALARFSAALDELEVRVKERLNSEEDTKNAATELAILRAERERLFSRVAALEDNSRLLASLTEEVEDRLDGAIAEIREVLGHS